MISLCPWDYSHKSSLTTSSWTYDWTTVSDTLLICADLLYTRHLLNFLLCLKTETFMVVLLHFHRSFMLVCIISHDSWTQFTASGAKQMMLQIVLFLSVLFGSYLFLGLLVCLLLPGFLRLGASSIHPSLYLAV